MKSIINKISIFLVIVFMFSCSDLDERPVGLLAPEGLFNTPSDVLSVIYGGYGALAHENIYGRQFNIALMLRSDMVDIGDRGTPAARQQVNDFNMDDNNAMSGVFWPRFYQVISAANAAIAGAESLSVSENVINPIIAEARFLRAFSYFHLVRNFGEIPYIDYFITNPEAVKTIAKSSVTEIYNGIITDFEYGKQWLPDKHGNSEIRSRATKGTAASYLATVYLTLADYQKAYNEAKWVIDNKDRFGYRLEADFQDLYRAEIADNIKETIFTVDFLGLQSGADNFNQEYNASMTGIRGADRSGWSVAVPSLAVYNTWDNRDYRKKVSFADSIVMGGVLRPYTAFANTQRPHIAKYFRYPGNAQQEYQTSDHNIILFRYAEILLTAAEALTEVSGPNAESVSYINQIRARARNWAGTMSDFPADFNMAGMNKEQFIDAIMEERRLELAFEAKRWYDIQRRRLGDIAFKGPNSLEPHANFDASRDYLMPIPRREIDVNPNLRPQNPGY
ncbi:MAG: RagB/SusD family nutrient uptake outer membrane protein [Cyclobacteriaceae bacterium]|nr:RagB/SusD family nutrient uptake outer membrane protein [Cyclobacteriaceae bacterium]